MDLWFWLVVIVAVTTIWFLWAEAFSLQTDLDLAEDEIRQAHSDNDRLRAEALTHYVRDARGQFRRAA